MRKITNGITTALVLLLTLFMLLPFMYMLICSMQITYSEYRISLDISSFTFDNYIKIFQQSNFLTWIKNSMFISIVGVIWTLLICSMAAYAFAKKRFPGDDKIYFLFFTTMCIPFPATVVPLWLMVGRMGLMDTFWPLILPIPSMLGVVLIRQAIISIPKEMFESAKIDGCADRKIFSKIVLPIIRPILITVAILFFTRSWNSLLWPLIVSNTDATKTLPVGLASIQGGNDINYGFIMAGSMMNFLPPFLVYIFLHKYFLAGITGNGLKN